MAKLTTKKTGGFVLLEVLVSILVLSLGIVGLISLQAVSARQSSDARYRSEAALLAGDLIGQMWVTNRTTTALQTYATGATNYNAWLAKVTPILPGIVGNAAAQPAVTVSGTGEVVVEVNWVAPGDTQMHTYTSVAQIR